MSNEYMKTYMKNRYDADPEKARKYRKSCMIKKKYDVSDEIWKTYKNDLYNLITINKLLNEMSDELREEFLTNREKFIFKEI